MTTYLVRGASGEEPNVQEVSPHQLSVVLLVHDFVTIKPPLIGTGRSPHFSTDRQLLVLRVGAVDMSALEFVSKQPVKPITCTFQDLDECEVIVLR